MYDAVDAALGAPRGELAVDVDDVDEGLILCSHLFRLTSGLIAAITVVAPVVVKRD